MGDDLKVEIGVGMRDAEEYEDDAVGSRLILEDIGPLYSRNGSRSLPNKFYS